MARTTLTSSTLIIVESPKKAKLLSTYCKNGFKVIASYGHVRTLPSKKGSVLPDKDFEMTWVQTDSAAAIIKDAKKFKSIILATDPDREGEAIGYHIAEILKQNKIKAHISRVRFNSLEKSAIMESINNATNLSQDLVDACFARLGIDYLVGFEISPILWRKIPGNSSAGRVQSVGLRIIIDREREIAMFNSQDYWEIGLFATNKATFRIKKWKGEEVGQFFYTSREHAESVAKEALNPVWIVDKVTAKTRKQSPYAPFTTGGLQQDASTRLNFRPYQTMKLAQELYEGVEINGELTGLITYMRTDSVNVHPSAIAQCREMIAGKWGSNYCAPTPRVYAGKNKNTQDAHEAIRPTNYHIYPEYAAKYLRADLAKLYRIIWNRAVASQMSDAIMQNTTVEAVYQDNMIETKGSVCEFAGYKKVYNNDAENDVQLPAMQEGQEIGIVDANVTDHKTQPPRRYSEAGLIKELEKEGIGRPSTYAQIISVLQLRGYVYNKDKSLIPEDRGWVACAFLEEWFSQYVANEFTARLEEKLDDIARGTLKWKVLMNEFWSEFTKYVGEARDLSPTDVQGALQKRIGQYLVTEKECPKCSGQPIVKYSRNGGFVGCPNYPECSWNRPLTKNQRVIHEDDNDRVVLKSGPYGMYAHWEQSGKMVTIPSSIKEEKVTWELIQKWIDLPRSIGTNNDGHELSMGIGRFGPYIKRVFSDGKIEYRSVPSSVDLAAVDVTVATEILSRERRVFGKRKRGDETQSKKVTAKKRRSS